MALLGHIFIQNPFMQSIQQVMTKVAYEMLENNSSILPSY
jgi:hypothetical protein